MHPLEPTRRKQLSKLKDMLAIFEQFGMSFHRYKEEPLFAESAPLGLVRYWDVRPTKYLREYTLNLCNSLRNRKLAISGPGLCCSNLKKIINKGKMQNSRSLFLV